MAFSIETKTSDYLFVVLTHECNRECRFCVDIYRGEEGFLTIPNFINALEFAKSRNIKTITLLGGEPTLHPGIVELCKMVKDEGFNLVMTTNFDNLEILYELDKYVDSFNFSYYGQRELPDPTRFIHADITLSTLIYRTGMLSSKEKLDAHIDKYKDKYILKFSTLSDINEFTHKNNKVEYLDELQDCTWVVLLNQIAGQIYRGQLIKRFDILLNKHACASFKCHVDGSFSQSWIKGAE